MCCVMCKPACFIIIFNILHCNYNYKKFLGAHSVMFAMSMSEVFCIGLVLLKATQKMLYSALCVFV